MVTILALKLKNKEKAKENLWFFLQLLNSYNYNIILLLLGCCYLFCIPIILIDGPEVYFLLTLISFLREYSKAFLLSLI